MADTIYNILSMFFVYSCMGWCLEVVFCGLNNGHFINRGFLNGPVCPIYGVGGVLIISLLTPISGNVFVLFAGAVVVTSLIEYLTGYALEQLYNARWWDYSKEPFNIKGYICLKFSLAWGIVGVILMRGIHPAVMKITGIFPKVLGWVLLSVFSAVFIADCIATFIAVKKLTDRMEVMEDIAKKIKHISDNLGKRLYGHALSVQTAAEGWAEKEEVAEFSIKSEKEAEELKAKIEELRKKYTALAEEKHFTHKRILKAFPQMKSKKFGNALEKIREKHKNNRSDD